MCYNMGRGKIVMEIQREDYLNQLVLRMHNGFIKVVTGARRCGKSYLLFTIFDRYLRQQGVKTSHIIKIAFDGIENKELRDPAKLYQVLQGKIKDGQMYYIFLDEIQYVDDFADVLNSLLRLPNVDVYVTGSNSKFLSSDILTEFRGRGDEIRVRPLSFREFVGAYPEPGRLMRAWDDYLTYGGLPHILALPTPQQKIKYLDDLFKETYLKDIIDRHNVRNADDLDDVVNVLASAIGSLTNPSKLEHTFLSVKRKTISDKTIKSYISYLEDAFLVESAQRYDVKGKAYIDTPLKYYFVDTGLRNARLNYRQNEENHLMENVIYNELRMRGYAVDIGMVEVYETNSDNKRTKKQLEIDFVATLGSEKYYIQSAFEMPTGEKERQEKRPLENVDDSFKKIVIVKDDVNVKRDAQGITMMGVMDFLLNPNSLNV